MAENKAQIVTLKTDAGVYELLCNKDMALKYRENPQIGFAKVLASDTIYSDARTGAVQPRDMIAKLGENPIHAILMKGHLQLSTEERRKRVEQRHQEIVGQIHGNYVDNAGNVVPHERVDAAVQQLKGLQIDPFGDLQQQVEDVIKRLEKANLLIMHSGGLEATITCQYATMGKVQAIIKKLNCVVISQDYTGEPKFTISISGGMVDQMMKELEQTCKGNFTFQFAGHHAENAPPAVENAGKGHKKGKK